MSSVNLDDEEWQRVLSIIAQAPWNVANPLLMKIGDQLRQHGNSKMQEVAAAQAHLESNTKRQ